MSAETRVLFTAVATAVATASGRRKAVFRAGRLLAGVSGFAILLTAAVGLPAPVAAQSISEALGTAYITNPQIEAQRARVRATDEGLPAAQAGWMPSVTAASSAGLDWSQTARPAVSRGTSLAQPRSATVTVDQAVYNGAIPAGIERAESQIQAERARLGTTVSEVLQSAAEAYMNVVRAGSVVELRRNNVAVLQRQLEATQDRFQVGENTRTDVAQAEARLSGARADLRSAEADLENSRAVYLQVIGETPGALVQPQPPTAVPLSLTDSQTVALDANPAVKAAAAEVKVAETEVDRAIAALLPTVSLQGTAGYAEGASTELSRGTSATITGRVSVPLYGGGDEFATVRQAKQNVAARKLDLERARRVAVQNATNAWEQLKSAEARIASFDAQVRAQTIALDGVQQEAQVGARTVLDVLDAEQELLNARVQLVGAQRDRIVAAYLLLSATGRLDPADLGLAVPLYDPTTYYNRTSGRLFGTEPAASK